MGGCAPLRTVTKIAEAQDAIRQAELKGAHNVKKGEKYITPAQYKYHLATLYLAKAKELQGFAKYNAACFYASRAVELALSAMENMDEEKRRKIRREQIKGGKIFTKHEP